MAGFQLTVRQGRVQLGARGLDLTKLITSCRRSALFLQPLQAGLARAP